MASGGVTAADGYRVRPGDTLSAVASHLHVGVAQLAAANGVADPNRISVGQVLKAPVASRSRSVSTSPSRSYRVRPGDTLSLVAPRLGVSEAELAAANSLANPNNIIAGRSLVLPGASGGTSGPPVPVSAASSTQVAGVGRSWHCPVPGAHFVDDYGYVKPDGTRHQGVDLYAPRFAPVLAPVAGTVTPYPNHLGGLAFQLSGTDGNRYYGAHLEAYGHTGRVSAGTVIGWVGNSGDAVGGPTHLHFEVHPGGGPVASPYPALTGSCP